MNPQSLQALQDGSTPVSADDQPTTTLTNNSPNAKRASAAQQAQFDTLLGRSRQLIGESAEQWLIALKENPVDGAVMLGTQTLRSLVAMSEKAGQPVDPVILIHTGIQLVKDAAALANAAGIVPDDQLEPFLQQVMQQSMAEYLHMDAQEGILTPEDQKRAQTLLTGAQSGEAPSPDNTPAHENAEPPNVEQQEGAGEGPATPSGYLQQLAHKGARA